MLSQAALWNQFISFDVFLEGILATSPKIICVFMCFSLSSLRKMFVELIHKRKCKKQQLVVLGGITCWNYF